MAMAYEQEILVLSGMRCIDKATEEKMIQKHDVRI